MFQQILLSKWPVANWRMMPPSSLSMDDIIDLLTLCLYATFLSFRGKVYKQVHRTTMGSPVSPVVTNLVMEMLKREPWRASLAPHGGRNLKQCVSEHHCALKMRMSKHPLWQSMCSRLDKLYVGKLVHSAQPSSLEQGARNPTISVWVLLD